MCAGDITRLAPSPTGSLHLGNARTFLINWLLARQKGWRIVLRIEDIDSPRVKPGADHSTLDDLRWLGIDWDDGPIYQTHRLERYQNIIDELVQSGRAYPCVCSRRDIEIAASAPHGSDQSVVYPGTCRDRFSTILEARELMGREPAIRFRVPIGSIEFNDHFAGHQLFDLQHEVGDFVIAKADKTPSYQLAVTVDDLDMGITQVVRGDDLLQSTAKQLLLMETLFPANRPPAYTHLPLVVGVDGLRLAKRHGDSRISKYRSRGVPPGAVMSLLARWCGCKNHLPSPTVDSLISRFDPKNIPCDPITFTQQDESFLNASACITE